MLNEIDANFERFFENWTSQAQENWKHLHSNQKYKESYRRLSCLHGVTEELIVPNFSPASAAFFLEAHNDALSSHVNASIGAWRSSLQNLRSSLENTLAAFYFKDHPIELKLWEQGSFRPAFSDLHKYMREHPVLHGVPLELSGLDLFKSEYGTLSKAVHGSAINFRMTDDVSQILLWNVDVARLGAWADREKHVVLGISLLCVAFFRNELTGTKKTDLRAALSIVIPKVKRASIKEKLKVTIHP